MVGHVQYMPQGITATGNQRIVWNKADGAFKVTGSAGFQGKIANWCRKTFHPERTKQENIDTYKAIKQQYKSTYNIAMPLSMRAALSGGRGGTITGAGLARADVAEAGNSPLQEKFARLGASMPYKMTVHDDRATDGKAKVLGKGAFNTVLAQKFRAKDGTGAPTYADKVIKPLTPPKTPGADMGWVSGKTGIDGAQPRWGDRNIAASKLNVLLGTGVISKSEFGVHKGEPCLVMDRAPGKVAATLLREKPEAARDPEIQRLTNHLELNIFLMGNGDNHANNYLIHYDESGAGRHRVTGIDNDQSFGKLMVNPDRAPGSDGVKHGYRHTGFPAVLDEQAFTKLMALDFDRDVWPDLSSHLSTPELVATKSRFLNAQAQAQQLQTDGRVIRDWTAWTQPDGSPAPGGDLFGATKDRTIPHAKGVDVPRSMLVRDYDWLDLKQVEAQKAEYAGHTKTMAQINAVLGISN